MGQKIKVEDPTIVGEVALFGTDRAITGQEGEAFRRNATSDTFGGRLAARIFGADDSARHVFVASNQVTVGREGGWDPNAVAAVSGTIERFFVFYD